MAAMWSTDDIYIYSDLQESRKREDVYSTETEKKAGNAAGLRGDCVTLLFFEYLLRVNLDRQQQG